jgi:hypothetical protein
MASVRRTAVCLAMLVLASGASATIWPVVCGQQTIQWVIDNPAVVDGDTLSVWGIGSPPFVFTENVDYRDKSLCVANACYLPSPPASPSPD